MEAKMDPTDLKKSIKAFIIQSCSQKNLGYSRVVLQLMGLTGQGKSCTINSCKHVLSDGEEFLDITKSGGPTRARKLYKLTENIYMADNRGLNTMDKVEKLEMLVQLGQFRSYEEAVEWRYSFTEMLISIEEASPNYTDLLVPVFVFSAKYMFPAQERHSLAEFMKNCTKLTGIPPIVVITHKSSEYVSQLESLFRLEGADHVIAVENYLKGDSIKTQGRSNDFLKIIDIALKEVTFCMELPKDPLRENIERKKMLLACIHDCLK